MGGGNNDIAVCGLGIKVADADNVDQYWENLLNKKNSIREVPSTRWNMKKFIHPEGKKGFYYSAFGSFIDDVDQFDPTPFRGISALEVPAMDPQHRWILQCAYQAFEDAGIDAYSANVDGSRTGVFIGLMNHDYMGQLTDLDDIEQANNTFVTGICGSIAPNRVSYVFNLLGPSFCVDTACSSSIVALHQACQAIINNECDSALVGGVNFMNSPTNFVILSQAKMMSKTGGCKAFDERGDGYTRGEGCGVVLIKRLSDAIRDKNKIYAVIKGTGVNSDGRTQAPMTSPSETMQFQLMEDVFKKANIDPSTISYIEAHGTGTPVGDPVEARAIGKFLGAGSGRDNKLWMDIGHLEGASGLAALIKICLMMKHKTIAPNLYFETPNPTIPFEELKLNVPTQSHPWPAPEGTKQGRRAALNCFGFGGTNSHCVLEEYIPPAESEFELHNEISTHHAITLSAVDSSALKAYASALLQTIQNSPDILLEDVGYTSFRRTHLKERAVIFPSSRDHAINLLSAFSDDSKVADLEKQGSIFRGASQGDKRICFVFSGQGTFWAGVGRVLMDTQPIFNSAIKEPLAGWTVWKTLNDMPKDDDNYSAPQYTATVCIFAIQIALVKLLAQWNIKPSFIVGHSVGETAASVVSGAVTLKDGVTLVHHRARLQSKLEGSGKMAAVAISEQEAETWLKPYGGKLEIAAVNSPLSLTIAGDGACILDFETKFKAANPDKMFVTLRLNSPYHTSFMEPMKKEFLECCGNIESQEPTVPIYSTVTGRKFESGNYSGNYFWENIRDPVLFSKAIQAVNKEEGCTIFLEIGPHPALGFNINQINTHSSKKTWTVVGTLTKKDKKWSSILKSLSRLHITSVPVDWTEFYSTNYSPKLVTLPSYQWQTKRYWIEGSHSIYMKHSSKQAGGPNGTSQSKHPLLQSPIVRDQKKGWQVELSTSDFPYLKDHNILGTLVLAAAFPLELTIAAAHNMRDSTAASLGDSANKYAVGVNFLVENPVLITPPTAPILKLDVDGTNLSLGDSVPFKILQSAKEGTNTKDAGSGRGSIFCVTKEVAHSVRDTANKIIDDALADESRDRKNKRFKRFAKSEVYASAAKHDYNFGPAHQGIKTAWTQQNGSTAIPEAIEDTASDYYLHPSLIDAIFHPSILCRTTELTVVPTCIQMIFFNKPKSQKMWSVFNFQNSRYAEFIMLDEDRKTVIFHMPYYIYYFIFIIIIYYYAILFFSIILNWF